MPEVPLYGTWYRVVSSLPAEATPRTRTPPGPDAGDPPCRGQTMWDVIFLLLSWLADWLQPLLLSWLSAAVPVS